MIRYIKNFVLNYISSWLIGLIDDAFYSESFHETFDQFLIGFISEKVTDKLLDYNDIKKAHEHAFVELNLLLHPTIQKALEGKKLTDKDLKTIGLITGTGHRFMRRVYNQCMISV